MVCLKSFLEQVERLKVKQVIDKEILSAQKEFIKQTGIFCEPSSASVFAAYNKLISENRVSAIENILLLITGNGLKDVEALRK